MNLDRESDVGHNIRSQLVSIFGFWRLLFNVGPKWPEQPLTSYSCHKHISSPFGPLIFDSLSFTATQIVDYKNCSVEIY